METTSDISKLTLTKNASSGMVRKCPRPPKVKIWRQTVWRREISLMKDPICCTIRSKRSSACWEWTCLRVPASSSPWSTPSKTIQPSQSRLRDKLAGILRDHSRARSELVAPSCCGSRQAPAARESRRWHCLGWAARQARWGAPLLDEGAAASTLKCTEHAHSLPAGRCSDLSGTVRAAS